MNAANKFGTALERSASAEAGPRVLVAVAERSRPRLSAILRGCGVTFVAARAQLALALKAGSFDLLVLGAHFDDSHALEALEETMRQHPRCPVVCVLARGARPLGRRSFYAYRTACLALGAREVVDLTQWPDDDAGNARVRALIEGMAKSQAC